MRILALLFLAGWCTAQEILTERLERNVRRLAAFGTRHTASTTEGDTRGIGAARRFLRAQFETIAKGAGGRMRVETQRFRSMGRKRLADGTELVNVFAVLEGRDPIAKQRMYVVSGHYDSRASDGRDAKAAAPGANDDASGVAVVLELAHWFAKRPGEATLVFLCVAGEEQGLIGARHFARRAREAKWNIAGMFTNDIVGNTLGPDGKRHTGYVRVFSEGTPAVSNPMEGRLRRSLGAEWDSRSRQLARYVHEQVAARFKPLQVKLIFRPDRFLRGGDHLAFNEAGFPAIRFTEPYENYKRQHQDVREGHGDLPDHVDYAYLTNVAIANMMALDGLVRGPAPPRTVRIHAQKLESSTTLSWAAGTEKDLSHYEVVWRDTTAALWQHVKKTKEPTITLPLSKDDWHFGVRAVDKTGHKSVVVYPRPLFPKR